MPASTRFLLGGYYGLVLLSLLLPYPPRHHFVLSWDHRAQYFSQTHRAGLVLLLSLLLCLIAILWIRQRLLTFTAAVINGFYAVGGFALFVWFLLMPGGYGAVVPEDAYIFLCAIFVPVVAAISFYESYRASAPNQRLERP